MAAYIDLYVHNGDFVFDDAGMYTTVDDQQSIGQDIKHRLIESELLLSLIGLRGDIEQQAVINQILIEVEKDTRLEPGTAQFTKVENGTYFLTANTLAYGEINLVL